MAGISFYDKCGGMEMAGSPFVLKVLQVSVKSIGDVGSKRFRPKAGIVPLNCIAVGYARSTSPV